MGFTTPSYGLQDLFSRIDQGELQLPDFQRNYKWNVDQIRSLIVTVLRGYPAGCLMALDTRNVPVRFRSRPLHGAPEPHQAPGLLLLDGQQRLTTLYTAMRGDGTVNSVDFRNKKVVRRFFVNLSRAVEDDVMPDDAVFNVDGEGIVKSHFAPSIPAGLSDREAVIEAGVIPVSTLLSGQATDLLFDLAKDADDHLREKIKTFYTRIVRPLAAYQLPMIRIGRETAQAGVGSIFAQANSVGLQMDVFELFTAVLAAEDPDFHLGKRWEEISHELSEYPALNEIGRTEFLTAVALVSTARRGHASGHREDILKLNLVEYQAAEADVRYGFREAALFLAQRCILSTEQVPFVQQLIPLAAIFALLNDTPDALRTTLGWDRLHRWFWSGVFGELYGSPAVTIRMGLDVDQVTAWIRSAASGDPAEEPKTVRDATFNESRLLSVTEDSGVYHGLYALLMGRGARDWRTGQAFNRWTYPELNPSFARIFPVSWCVERGVDKDLAASLINRTPMGKRTEVVTEGTTPARYLARVQSKSLMDDEEFDAVLASHDVDVASLHAGDAATFLQDRKERIIGIVEYAMDKAVIRDLDTTNLSGGEEGPEAFLK
ncbi:DUF262 domain-containing protein [Corynebacterium sp. 3HC-13]|uniref:GmrSD restriction endonuclease domain-containing protein n=1 Tax=Corynebacterium poyangense TaxID=2684405 RepID=UPI001CCCF165|nr:DUF262 domain-containing protein [Corynebacterium poyangense]MBZ8177134.1 DUF262 domain-containing protein [Corynebacterium poyangense]